MKRQNSKKKKWNQDRQQLKNKNQNRHDELANWCRFGKNQEGKNMHMQNWKHGKAEKFKPGRMMNIQRLKGKLHGTASIDKF